MHGGGWTMEMFIHALKVGLGQASQSTSSVTTPQKQEEPRSFTVVLDSEPSADVTIPISSENVSEGTVSVSSLTFTSANWNYAQTVTVTGVDDSVVDDNATYHIEIGAASSSDQDYDGMNAIDAVMVNINDDDDSPVGTLTCSWRNISGNGAPLECEWNITSPNTVQSVAVHCSAPVSGGSSWGTPSGQNSLNDSLTCGWKDNVNSPSSGMAQICLRYEDGSVSDDCLSCTLGSWSSMGSCTELF